MPPLVKQKQLPVIPQFDQKESIDEEENKEQQYDISKLNKIIEDASLIIANNNNN